MEKTLGIYVAGPMVFWPGGEAITAEYKALCREKGFLVPECVTQLQEQDTPFQRACKLRSRCVERLVQSDCIIANLDRFRGEESDSGTLFEVGMGIALGHRLYFYGQRPPKDLEGLVWPDFSAALEACSRDAARDASGRKTPPPAGRRDEVLLAGFSCCPAGQQEQQIRWANGAEESAPLEDYLLPPSLRALADCCRSAMVNLEDMPGGTEPLSSLAVLCGYLYGKGTPYSVYMGDARPMAQRISGAHTAPSGRMEDLEGNMIEPFGLSLNLMLATTASSITDQPKEGVRPSLEHAVVLPG